VKALRVGVVALLVAAACAGRPAVAQTQPGAPAGFELTRSVQQTLARVQELWLQWVGASLRDDRARADESLRGLVGAVREVGFHRLPDLALGAAAQARQSARAGEFERARRQLQAADALDPGRPEIAFAAAAVARAESSWFDALASTVRGLWLAQDVETGAHVGVSVALWFCLLLLAVSALFVALLAFVHAPEAILALRERLEPPLPTLLSALLLVLALFAPAVLPSGIFWLLLVWSALLWAFASKSERVLLALGWLVAATVPLAIARLQREVALDQSPPMRAVVAFEQRRLHGGFFADLQVLRAALPTHPAALELTADVHRTLGQWELARALYRRVLVDDPDNVPAMLNLGAYYFRKGDYAFANSYFERATRGATPSAAAWFNLSVGYSADYQFDESGQALTKARAIDSAAVDRWISTENPDRVLTFNGSLNRQAELRDALFAAWSDPKRGPSRSLRGDLLRAAAVALGAPLAALLAGSWLRRPLSRPKAAPQIDSTPAARWLRVLLPAIPAAERGSGFGAWGNLALLTALALLPQLFDLAGDVPLPGWPAPTVLATVAVLGASLYTGLRLHAGLVAEE
jgi:tetratricopeptide (TPR) repeat protein